MLIHCVSVLEAVERRSYQEGLYLVVQLTGCQVNERKFTWGVVAVLPRVYASYLGAAIAAVDYSGIARAPYFPEATHDSQVDEESYRLACQTQGFPCILPEPPAPAADDLVGKGA